MATMLREGKAGAIVSPHNPRPRQPRNYRKSCACLIRDSRGHSPIITLHCRVETPNHPNQTWHNLVTLSCQKAGQPTLVLRAPVDAERFSLICSALSLLFPSPDIRFNMKWSSCHFYCILYWDWKHFSTERKTLETVYHYLYVPVILTISTNNFASIVRKFISEINVSCFCEVCSKFCWFAVSQKLPTCSHFSTFLPPT